MSPDHVYGALEVAYYTDDDEATEKIEETVATMMDHLKAVVDGDKYPIDIRANAARIWVTNGGEPNDVDQSDKLIALGVKYGIESKLDACPS